MTKSPTASPAPVRPRRRLRKALFAAAATILALLALTALLKALEATGAIGTHRLDDRVAYLPANWRKVKHRKDGDRWRIRHGAMLKTEFTVPPPPDTVRLVVAGGSFAMGTPYVHQKKNKAIGHGGIPDWLRAELQMRFPRRRIEVINAAGGGLNSGPVRGVVERLVQARPDAVILATGNNEGFVPATRFHEALHEWIVYRALTTALRPEPPAAQRDFFMLQDEDNRAIERRYRDNIVAMIDAAQRAGVTLIVCTMPINLLFAGPYPPVKSYPHPVDDVRLNAGLEAQNEGDYAAAIEHYSASEHPSFAALYIARCFLALEQYDQARRFLRLHVQLDPKNRTRPSYNEFLRETAAARGMPLADLERRAEDLSPHGLPGSNLFVDYCHLNWHGYYEMTQVILDVLLADLPALAAPGPKPTRDDLIAREGWNDLPVLH